MRVRIENGPASEPEGAAPPPPRAPTARWYKRVSWILIALTFAAGALTARVLVALHGERAGEIHRAPD